MGIYKVTVNTVIDNRPVLDRGFIQLIKAKSSEDAVKFVKKSLNSGGYIVYDIHCEEAFIIDISNMEVE